MEKHLNCKDNCGTEMNVLMPVDHDKGSRHDNRAVVMFHDTLLITGCIVASIMNPLYWIMPHVLLWEFANNGEIQGLCDGL